MHHAQFPLTKQTEYNKFDSYLILLMATRNPVNSPLEVDSFSPYLQGFHTSKRWLGFQLFNSRSKLLKRKPFRDLERWLEGATSKETRPPPHWRSRLRSFRKPGDFAKKIVRSGSSKSIAYSIHMAFWVVEILGESTHGLLKILHIFSRLVPVCVWQDPVLFLEQKPNSYIHTVWNYHPPK